MTKQKLLQKAKPILFNTDMVRAILDGRKTVTRRVIKYKNNFDPNYTIEEFLGDSDPQLLVSCAPYQAGDILYVRETWADIDGEIAYRADDEIPHGWHLTSWHPSIHMPKLAARIFLRVTGARVERLQNMNLDDFLAEGVGLLPEAFNDPDNAYGQAQSCFFSVWDSTIRKSDLDKYGWEANPWVWVYEFERVNCDD